MDQRSGFVVACLEGERLRKLRLAQATIAHEHFAEPHPSATLAWVLARSGVSGRPWYGWAP